MSCWLAVVLLLLLTQSAYGGELAPCVGDCDTDGVVAVYEAVIGINIALGVTPISACSAFDRDGNGSVGVDELIGSIGSMLNGCTPVGPQTRLVPLGEEFRVSAGTLGLRNDPQVAVQDDGSFLSVWLGETSIDPFGVAGRNFTSSGEPGSPVDFDVNTFTVDAQRNQDVATMADGSYLVVWETSGIIFDISDPNAGIYARRFDGNALALGSEFKVNTDDTLLEEVPVAAGLANDNAVVLWSSGDPADSSTTGVYGQILDANGQKVGEQFSVNTYTTGLQTRPAVAAMPDGGFVAVWEDAYRDGQGFGVFGQRFDSSAEPVGSDFLVNEYTVGPQRSPSIAVDENGRFLVTWSSTVFGDEEVFARRFDSGAQPIGTEFKVNTSSLGQQAYSSTAAEPGGGFLVVWESGGSIGSFNIFGQRVGAGGQLVGSEFQVNTYTSNTTSRTFPEVSSNSQGDMVVVWEGQGQDGGGVNDISIRGQRYQVAQ